MKFWTVIDIGQTGFAGLQTEKGHLRQEEETAFEVVFEEFNHGLPDGHRVGRPGWSVGVQRNYSQKMSVSTGTNTQAEGQDVVPVASRVKAQISKFFTGGISGLGSDDITLGSRLEAVQSNRLENVDAEGGSNGMSDGQTRESHPMGRK